MPHDHFTTAEAAAYLGLSRRRIWNLNSTRDGDFPTPVYVGRTPQWTRAQLDDWRVRHPAQQRKTQSSS